MRSAAECDDRDVPQLRRKEDAASQRPLMHLNIDDIEDVLFIELRISGAARDAVLPDISNRVASEMLVECIVRA